MNTYTDDDDDGDWDFWCQLNTLYTGQKQPMLFQLKIVATKDLTWIIPGKCYIDKHGIQSNLISYFCFLYSKKEEK